MTLQGRLFLRRRRISRGRTEVVHGGDVPRDRVVAGLGQRALHLAHVSLERGVVDRDAVLTAHDEELDVLVLAGDVPLDQLTCADRLGLVRELDVVRERVAEQSRRGVAEREDGDDPDADRPPRVPGARSRHRLGVQSHRSRSLLSPLFRSSSSLPFRRALWTHQTLHCKLTVSGSIG